MQKKAIDKAFTCIEKRCGHGACEPLVAQCVNPLDPPRSSPTPLQSVDSGHGDEEQQWSA
ncbi:MAG: hypothetical protein KJ011_07855 [Burkholderiaceae bacterium]|nr:hypothetical protein [Burkholderiaceae bacterium]